MTPTMPRANPLPATRPGRAGGVALMVLLAAGLFAALAWTMRDAERAIRADAEREAAAYAVRPTRSLPDVAKAARAMKLVTVEIDTRMKVEKMDPSWRGDVAVAIDVPVRLHFGVDLSGLDVSSLGFSALSPSAAYYVVRIPHPVRLAAEVLPEAADPEVTVGWLRLRSRGGEYWLSQARRDVALQAQSLRLSANDMDNVRRLTKEQVAALIHTIVGDQARVDVVFDDTRLRAEASK